MSLVLKIITGIMISFFFIVSIIKTKENYENKEIEKYLKKELKEIEKYSENQIKRKSEIKEINERRKADKIRRENELRRNKEIKNKAWSIWYEKRKIKGCEQWKNERHMIICTNKKMDLKERFNKEYKNQI